MPQNFAALRQKYEGYTDAEIIGAIQSTQYPDYTTDEVGSALGWKPPKNDGLMGVVRNIWTGTKQTGRMVDAAGNTITGDLTDVEQIAERSKRAAKTETPAEQRILQEQLSKIDREQGVMGQVGDTLSTAASNKMGTTQMVAEQLPNTAVVLGTGAVGAKVGAMTGAGIGTLIFPGVGTAVGGVVGGTLGFIGGMFLGTAVLEVGGKAIEKAESGFTPEERSEAIREGTVKAGVITAVDVATLGAGGKAISMMGRVATKAGARAEAKVLIDAGVDMSSHVTINAALAADKVLMETAKTAGKTAAASSLSASRKAVIAGTGLTMETAGEGLGEYWGEELATGKGDVVDATIEALSSVSQSAIQTAYNYNKTIGNNLNAKGIAAATPRDPLSTIIDKVMAPEVDTVDKAITAAAAPLYQTGQIDARINDRADLADLVATERADLNQRRDDAELAALVQTERRDLNTIKALAERERQAQADSLIQQDAYVDQQATDVVVQGAGTSTAPTAMEQAFARAQPPVAPITEDVAPATPVAAVEPQDYRIVERTEGMVAMPRTWAEKRVGNGEVVRVANVDRATGLPNGKFAYTVIAKGPDAVAPPTPAPTTVVEPKLLGQAPQAAAPKLVSGDPVQTPGITPELPRITPDQPQGTTDGTTPEKSKPPETGQQATTPGLAGVAGEVAPLEQTKAAKEQYVADKIKSAPSYPQLLAAYKRHLVSIYGKDRADTSSYEAEPWKLITADSGVMNYKSGYALTLRNLAAKVIKETGFARLPAGRYRGMDGIDFDKVETPPQATPLAGAVTPSRPAAPLVPLTRAKAIESGPAVVLQNRDRSSAASIAQMTEIAKNPDYLRAGQATVMDTGAPVVFGDTPTGAAVGRNMTMADGKGDRVKAQYAVVEASDLITSHQADGSIIEAYATGEAGKLRAVAGNGRAAGITQAYRQKTADQYRADLADDAENLGIGRAAIEAMKSPILVRIMDAKDVKDDIGDRSNIASAARMSPVEQAATDAKRLDLGALEFTEDGNPTPKSIQQFIRAMPTSEQGEMMNADGTPGKQAIDRLMAAAFKQAYGSDDLVQLYAQATDPEARTIMSALADAAGAMQSLKDAGDFDIRGSVAEAAGIAINAKRKGEKLSDYLKTVDMATSGEAIVIARVFADNIRSAKRISEALRALARNVMAQVQIERDNLSQSGMFGDAPVVSRESIFRKFQDDNKPIKRAGDPPQQPQGPEAAGRPAAPQANIARPENLDPNNLPDDNQAEGIEQQNRERIDSQEFQRVLGSESIGGNAGVAQAGINFSFDGSGRIVSIGNIQNLTAAVRARIESGELHEATFSVLIDMLGNQGGDKIVDVQFNGESPTVARAQIQRLVSDALVAPTREEVLAEQARVAKIEKDKADADRVATAAAARRANMSESERRAANILAEREAAKKAEVDAAGENFGLGNVPPAPVDRVVTAKQKRGQKSVFDAKPDAPVEPAKPTKAEIVSHLDAAGVVGDVRLAALDRFGSDTSTLTLDDLKAAYPIDTKSTAFTKGQLVTLMQPSLNGPTKRAGSVDSVLPDGKIKVRLQLGGFDTVAASELTAVETDKPAAAPTDTNLESAARLLLTRNRYGDIFALAGDSNSETRQSVMSALMGRKVPKSQSGVTAIQKEFYARAGITEDTGSGKNAAFDEWLKQFTPPGVAEPTKKYTSKNAQLQLFLDSEPDPSQTGPAVEMARRDAVAAVDDLHATGTVLAKALSSDYAARQRVSLVGQTVSGIEDLAVLAQVYRDPRFETFRVIFTNNKGEVVSQIGLTSRLPGSAIGIVGNDIDTYLQDLARTARKRGASSFYMLHNHPSGQPNPSKEDKALTIDFASRMPGIKFNGHVVIDTNSYAVIDADGDSGIYQRDFGQADPLGHAEFGNFAINKPADVMTLAKRVQVDENAVTLIVTDSQYRVRAITILPSAAITDNRTRNMILLAKAALKGKGASLFAVGRDAKLLAKLGWSVIDAIHIAPDGSTTSLRETGAIGGRGQAFPSNRPTRLSPDTSAEFGYLRPFTQQRSARRVAENDDLLTGYTAEEGLKKQEAEDEALKDKQNEAYKKATAGRRPTVDQNDMFNDQSTLFSRKEPFYSALSRGIEGINAKAMTSAMWTDGIKGLVNKGTVKQDEVEWSGVNEFLALQTGKVTKEQVVEFLDANGVQVTETVLGGRGTFEKEFTQAMAERLDDLEALRDRTDDQDAERQSLITAENAFAPAAQTKFDQYQLPGGSNYREVLLTLPGKREAVTYQAVPRFEPTAARPFAVYDIGSTPNALNHNRAFATMEEAQAYAEEQNKRGISRESSASYQSSHWQGTPNVLAHIRMNDRVDADGGKTLFIEELQSDFGQSFKKQKDAIKKAVDNDFEAIIGRMKKAGVLEVNCD